MTQLTETTVHIATATGSESVTGYTLNSLIGVAITETPLCEDNIGYTITHIASGRKLFSNPCPDKQTAVRVLKWLANVSAAMSFDWTAARDDLDLKTAKEIVKAAERRFRFLRQ